MSEGYRVAVVGATGQVGTLMLAMLRERAFPARELVAFASERSIGRELDGGLTVRGLSDESIQGFDVAIFSAGGATSGEWAPRFADAGAVVIDNSSRWRMQTTCRWSSARSTRTRSQGTAGSSPTPTARRCRWSSR